jgi:hypothetical protein
VRERCLREMRLVAKGRRWRGSGRGCCCDGHGIDGWCLVGRRKIFDT